MLTVFLQKVPRGLKDITPPRNFWQRQGSLKKFQVSLKRFIGFPVVLEEVLEVLEGVLDDPDVAPEVHKNVS